MPPIFSALILANCDDDDSLIDRLLSSSSATSSSVISYSLYLFHPLSPRLGVVWPEKTFDVDFLPDWPRHGGRRGCAIVFAFGMYTLVEMPAQRKLGRSGRAGTAAGQRRQSRRLLASDLNSRRVITSVVARSRARVSARSVWSLQTLAATQEAGRSGA